MSEKISKHFHLTLHFTVTGDESKIPAENEEYNERQRRLFKAVVSDKKTLDVYQRYLIAGWLELEGSRYFDDMLLYDVKKGDRGFREAETILDNAIAELDASDREWFAEVEEEGIFYENTEVFHDCFEANIVGVDFTEVEMRGHQ